MYGITVYLSNIEPIDTIKKFEVYKGGIKISENSVTKYRIYLKILFGGKNVIFKISKTTVFSTEL